MRSFSWSYEAAAIRHRHRTEIPDAGPTPGATAPRQVFGGRQRLIAKGNDAVDEIVDLLGTYVSAQRQVYARSPRRAGEMRRMPRVQAPAQAGFRAAQPPRASATCARCPGPAGT